MGRGGFSVWFGVFCKKVTPNGVSEGRRTKMALVRDTLDQAGDRRRNQVLDVVGPAEGGLAVGNHRAATFIPAFLENP